MINTNFKPNDSVELSKILKINLGNQLDIKKITENNEIIGNYLTKQYENNTNSCRIMDSLPIKIKYISESFAEVKISDKELLYTSLEEKLAAMSDIYMVLKEMMNEPLAFYTYNEKRTNDIVLLWQFKKVKETMDMLSFFEKKDKSLNNLIIIDKKQFFNKEELPNEVSFLIKNIPEYNKNKFGNNLNKEYVKRPKK